MAPHARSWIFAAVLQLVFAPASLALQAPEGLDALDEREQELLEAIASRTSERREAALAATQHPDVLVRIELIQARSGAAFDLRIQRLDREHQEELWELVRTPGVLGEVVTGGEKDAAALDAIAEQRPEPVRAAIRHLGREHFELLQEADAIKASADIEFGEEVAPLPESAREAFAQLLEDPELLAMLARSPSALVAIGEAFAADPEATRERINELAVAVAAANRAVEEEWRDGLTNDPEARGELEQAAREYADEYGYEYDDLTSEDVRVSVRQYYSPYPYWFGYPRWYAYWYPWGWWYPVYPHFGFYYGPSRYPVSFGLPSLHFVHWFYGGHHHRYKRVARHFDHRRHHHHRSSHAVYRTVRRHERHSDWRAHRHGSPETIGGRTFRSRDGRRGAARGSRRGEFRSRTVRMPDGTFGRHFDRDWRRGEHRERTHRAGRRDRGRAERVGRREGGRAERVDRREGGRAERVDRRERGRAERVDRREGGRAERVDRRERGRAVRVDRRERGRAVRVDRLPRVDAAGRHRGRLDRTGPSRAAQRRVPRVARSDVARPIRVRSGRGQRATRVAPTPSPASPRARADRGDRSPRVERARGSSRAASVGRAAKSRRDRSAAFQSKERSSGASRSRAIGSGGRSRRGDGGARVGRGGSGRVGRGGGARGGRH
ncbi:MAG: hypothetical protein VX681_08535 [Myxococcota bacterium]|nr:hypothetical protein [Myxococcota bacterium]